MEFVNSHFADHTGSGLTFDRLMSPEWRRWFGNRCGLNLEQLPRGVALQRLLNVRDLLRDLLASGKEPNRRALAELNLLLGDATMTWHLASASDLRLMWKRDDWRAAMAAVVVSYAELVDNGGLTRVRVCANRDCTWMFSDDSRNRSRRFCDPKTCGNLVRVRRHRASRR